MDAKYEQRKKMIYDFMCDDMYVPMKIKELAIVLGVKKDQRPQLEQILNELMTGRAHCLFKERKVQQIRREKDHRHVPGTSERIRICQRGGEKEDIFIPESKTNGAMLWIR